LIKKEYPKAAPNSGVGVLDKETPFLTPLLTPYPDDGGVFVNAQVLGSENAYFCSSNGGVFLDIKLTAHACRDELPQKNPISPVRPSAKRKTNPTGRKHH
jgi:hypothetical protein